jgi:predicted kinase
LIVWLNGNFGVGKTSTARELSALWPAAIVVDPEAIGVGLSAWTPSEAQVRDFQDIQLWRDLVVMTCAGMVAEWGRPLIVPMTVLRPAYFEDIVQTLRQNGADVHHFCLTAAPSVLRARAEERSRVERDGGELSWIEERWALYDAFDPLFAEHIDATTGSAAEVARMIASRLPQPLPASVGPARWAEWQK